MFRLPAAATVGLLAASCRSFSPGHAAGFHRTAITLLKEIHADKVDKTLVIQGITVPSPRKVVLVRNKSECCSLCSLNLNVKHTDVLILSQFLRSDGCMLPQRVTGLCKTQQKIMSKLVSMAHKAGLMCNIAPENSKKDPTKRRDWKKYNTYYDESTIKVYENHFNIKKKDIILKYAQSKNI